MDISALSDAYRFDPLVLTGWEWFGLFVAFFGGWIVLLGRAWRAVALGRLAVQQAEVERDEALAASQDAIRDRQRIRFEHQLSSALLPHRPPERALALFLKAIAPNSSSDFAGLIRRNENDIEVIASRGKLPSIEILATLPAEPPPHWKVRADKAACYLMPTLTEYWVVASTLRPPSISEDAAREILTNVLPAAAERATALTGVLSGEEQLASTVRMLKLREAAEAVRRQGAASVVAYLDTLLAVSDWKRATVFLRSDEDPKTVWRRLATTGQFRQVGIDDVVGRHERAIIEQSRTVTTHWSKKALQAAQVDSLVTQALAVPLRDKGRLAGFLCLTTDAAGVVAEEEDNNFNNWLADHLLELLKTLRQQYSIERQATIDGLTGLTNRAEFDRILASTLAAVDDTSPCCLILFDLDHFKQVNDNYGHAAGDAALKHVAEVLRQAAMQARQADDLCLARYGGEELAMLIPSGDVAAGLRLAELVRKMVATTPFEFEGQRIPLTLSAGVAEGPQHGDQPTSLLQAADTGLYASKRLGRNRVTDASRTKSLDAMKETLTRKRA